MGHTIDVRKSSRSRSIDIKRLTRMTRRVVRTVLDGEDLHDAELSAWFVDRPTTRQLNRRHRQVNRPTDVLAFPLAEPEEIRRPGVLLGDVVISLPTARSQALALGHCLEAEVALLLIHGVLHLLGYDHQRPADARRMQRKERRYLDECGIRTIHHGSS